MSTTKAWKTPKPVTNTYLVYCSRLIENLLLKQTMIISILNKQDCYFYMQYKTELKKVLDHGVLD